MCVVHKIPFMKKACVLYFMCSMSALCLCKSAKHIFASTNGVQLSVENRSSDSFFK